MTRSRLFLLFAGAAFLVATLVPLLPSKQPTAAPLHLSGSGTLSVAWFLQFVDQGGNLVRLDSQGTVGDELHFGIDVTRMPDGTTYGQIQIRDSNNYDYHVDDVAVDLDPTVRTLFGTPPNREGRCYALSSAGNSIYQWGSKQAFWSLEISPLFDGEGESPDAMYVVVRDNTGKVRQAWAGFVTEGDVQVTRY